MKKFKFTLDKLKSFKEQVKKKEENELAALRMRYHELIAEREAMEAELEKKNKEFIENSAKGMTAREVVTRMLRYFQAEGMVQLTRGTVELTDLPKLEDLENA